MLDDPTPHIHLNSGGLVEVPNSKSAYRHLFDVDMIPCGLDTSIDSDPAFIHLQKKQAESFKQRPSGLTTQRKYQDITRLNRVQMPSY